MYVFIKHTGLRCVLHNPYGVGQLRCLSLQTGIAKALIRDKQM